MIVPYAKVRIGDKTYYKQRLEWEKAHGRKIPKGMVIDHKNGNTYDNKPSNLEAVSVSENKKRSDKMHSKKKK